MFCRQVFGNILADFAVFRIFGGISQDFAEIPEFRGSATAWNIRSPGKMKRSNENGAKKIYESPAVTKIFSEIRNAMSWVKTFQIAKV